MRCVFVCVRRREGAGIWLCVSAYSIVSTLVCLYLPIWSGLWSLKRRACCADALSIMAGSFPNVTFVTVTDSVGWGEVTCSLTEDHLSEPACTCLMMFKISWRILGTSLQGCTLHKFKGGAVITSIRTSAIDLNVVISAWIIIRIISWFPLKNYQSFFSLQMVHIFFLIKI